MALNRIETDGIEDDAITTDKILDGTVGPADIGDGELTNTQISASAAIAVSKISGLGTAAAIDFGTGANQILQLDGSGNLPAVNASALTNLDAGDLTPSTLPALNGSNLTNLTSGNLIGALPAISGANLTGVSTDTSAMENNIAILAFKTQTANNLAKFNLVDQVVDEYYDTTGIDDGASSGNITGGSGIAKYYQGGTSTSPTVTHNSDSGPQVHGDYTWYRYTSTGSVTYTTDTNQDHDFLVIAGGGAGGSGNDAGGGGGAGGYRNSWASEATGGGGTNEAALSLVASTTYTVTVGTGGAGVSGINIGNSGVASSITGSDITDITTVGGGGGGKPTSSGDGLDGGSGGGGGGANGSLHGDGTPTQGHNGGTVFSGQWSGSGGGGAGGAGVNVPSSGNNQATGGGAGLTSSIDGTPTFRGGGGGGNGDTTSTNSTAGGTGGGGAGVRGTGVAGLVNTGSGGGSGHTASGAGGTGIVIIRRLTSVEVAGSNLTLQSVENTALTSPTTGDIVMLIENAGSGAAVLGTNIKVFVSRNGGTNWYEATGSYALTDVGTWGSGTKKIITANGIPFAGPAGTDMRYKIQTLAQSAGTMETRIHATSLAWA